MKDKNVPIITVLLIVAVCLSIGYVMIFKSGLNIKNNKSTMKENNWKLSVDIKNKIDNSNIDLKIDGTDINIKGKINKDDEIKYILNIKNSGTIDANFYTFLNSNKDITIKLLDDGKDLEVGTIIKPKESKEIELIIKSNKEEEIDFESALKLVFNQNGN